MPTVSFRLLELMQPVTAGRLASLCGQLAEFIFLEVGHQNVWGPYKLPYPILPFEDIERVPFRFGSVDGNRHARLYLLYNSEELFIAMNEIKGFKDREYRLYQREKEKVLPGYRYRHIKTINDEAQELNKALIEEIAPGEYELSFDIEDIEFQDLDDFSKDE